MEDDGTDVAAELVGRVLQVAAAVLALALLLGRC